MNKEEKNILQGNFRDSRFSDVLNEIQKGKRTGILTIEHGPDVKKIFINKGNIVYASSGATEDQVGEVLLKEGVITLEEYNNLIEFSSKTGQKIEKVIPKLGYISQEKLLSLIRNYIESIIIGIFTIEEGSFTFLDSDLPEEVFKMNLRFSAACLIYKGIKNINNFVYLKKLCPPIDTVLCISQDPSIMFKECMPDDKDKQILSYINGLYSLKILLLFSPLSDFETLKTICAFMSMGLIKIKGDNEAPFELPEGMPEKPPEKISKTFIHKIELMFRQCETSDYYAVLGIEKNASANEIKKAYYTISQKFHPERDLSFPPEYSEMKKKIIKILSYTRDAYDTLTDQKKREDYDKQLALASETTAKEPKGETADTSIKAPVKKKDTSEKKINAEAETSKPDTKEKILTEEPQVVKAPEVKNRRKKTQLYISLFIIIAGVLAVVFAVTKVSKIPPEQQVRVATKEKPSFPLFRHDLFEKLKGEPSEKR